MTRGLTQTDLGRKLGCTQQFVQRFESGVRNAPLSQVADALDFPPEFFLLPEIEPIPDDGISFRKRKSATLQLRLKIAGLATIGASNLSQTINRYVHLPSLALLDLRRWGPEGAATQLRADWNLGFGPIDNMIHLLEAKGVEVYFLREESRSVDALCFWRDERAYVLLNTTKLDGGRARFDAAHELGHLVLHHGRDFATAPNDDAEREADRFASAFLLPDPGFRVEAPTIFDVEAFESLRRRWKVSMQAMVRRLFDLGAFTKWQYEDAYIKMSERGYRSGPEPGAPAREASYVHEAVLDLLGDKGISPLQIARESCISLDDLCTLMPSVESVLDGQREAREFMQTLGE